MNSASNLMGTTYDCGEFEACMDKALQAADWPGFAERKADAIGQELRGIGYASYIQAPVGAGRVREGRCTW